MLKNEIYSLFLFSIKKHWVDPKIVSHDKSLFSARGRVWHKKKQSNQSKPKCTDIEAKWGYCEAKKKWIYGYSVHLSSVCTPANPVFPVFANLTTANEKGNQSLSDNLDKIPKQTKHILADSEYDSNELYEKSNKRLIAPVRETKNWKTKKDAMSRERKERKKLFETEKYRKIYRLRGTTIEQMFNILKNVFGIETSWFCGKAYTETLMLTAVFAYQIFALYSIRNKLPFRRIQRIKPFLDRL